jgi:hypothetical protein
VRHLRAGDGRNRRPYLGDRLRKTSEPNSFANEQGMKVAQNVAAGVVGLVIWPSGSEWISRVPRVRTPQTYKLANSI